MNDIELLERRIVELEERLASTNPVYAPEERVLIEGEIVRRDSAGDYLVVIFGYNSSDAKHIWFKPSQIRGRA